jgi:putative transposase
MSARAQHLGRIDLREWATVAHTELTQPDRATFTARQRAIELYVTGTAIAAIETATKVDRFTLYRLLRRCQQPHPDGRMQGFRALLPRHRVVSYQRKASPSLSHDGGHRGLVGAFSFLLTERPQLRSWIEQLVAQRWSGAIIVEEPLRLRGIGHSHEQFIAQCRALGLTRNDYPLNTKDGALRTFSGFVRSLLRENFAAMARMAGATHLKGLPREARDTVFSAPAARAPYEIVEFDAHRVDVRLKIVEVDPLGIPTEYEIDRVWLLVIIDVFTRAVLGYQIVSAAHINRFDVIRTAELALEPHARRVFSTSELAYPAAGGFPSMLLPELNYACWQWLRLDNDTANLAEDTLATLCELVGCHIDAGPPYHPDARPYIERFFGTLTRHLSHRLPGTTGCSPQDVRRRLSDPKGALRLLLTLNELEDLMEYAIADYNGTPHGSLAGRTPLETMHAFVRDQGQLPRVLPEPRRRSVCLLHQAHTCIVRAYMKSGRRPHINLFGIAHTSKQLAESASFVGKPLLIYYNPSDMRNVQAYLPDRTELGTLTAQGYWGQTRHTLTLRKTILRLRRAGQLRYLETSDPFAAYLEYHRSRAAKNKKSASALASLRKLLLEPRASTSGTGTLASTSPQAPTMRAPTTKPIPAQTLAPQTPAAQTQAARRKPLVVTRLEIGTGHSYRMPP